MSDRDPRYNPMELLINATEADTETAAEWSALYDFQKIADDLQKEKQKRDNFVRYSASKATLPPTLQENFRLQVADSEKRIKQFVSQLQKMSQSEVLKPVVWRVYQKVVEADLIEFRIRQKAEEERKWQEMRNQYHEQYKANAEYLQKQQEQICVHTDEPGLQKPTIVMESMKAPPHQNARPNVFKAIGTALLGTIAFALAYIVACILFSLIIYILNAIPVVNTLLGWFFEMRGDSPALMLVMLAPSIGYTVTVFLQSKINKNSSTLGLSLVITGSLLVALHLVSLVLNLIYGNAILANIAQAIAGIVMIIKGAESMRRT